MNALILGGNSPRHKEWVRQVAEALQPQFERVEYVDYRHWDSDGEADLEHELLQAAEHASKLGEDYIVIGKSLGICIATIATARKLLKPKACLFLGLPLGLFGKVPEALAALASLPPATLVQHEHDPLGSFQDVQAFISRHGNGQTVVTMVPGDTHDYADFNLITRLAPGENSVGSSNSTSQL